MANSTFWPHPAYIAWNSSLDRLIEGFKGAARKTGV